MFERMLDRTERMINTSEFYIATWLVGSVIGFLYLISGNLARVYLVLYLLVWTMATIRIGMERRYFQRYEAILASSQFVLLPFLVVAVGLLLSPSTEPIIIDRIVFRIYEYRFVFLHTTVLGLPHLIFQSYVFWKIHRKEWLGFAVHRKLFRSRFVPFLLHSAITAVLGYLISVWKTFDAVTLLAIAFWIFSTIKYYVLGRHVLRRQSRRRQEIAFRSTHSNAFLNDYLHRPPRRENRRRQQPQTTQSENGRPRRPQLNTTLARNEPGREINTRIEPRREINARIKPRHEIDARKNGKTGMKLLPAGKVKKEDLACTICYEPIRSNDGTIVLCPHCRFPAHEKELKEWRKESNLCPRCSKTVSRVTSGQKIEATKYSRLVLNKMK